MLNQPFDRSKHVYVNHEFDELVKDAVRFFNGTPVHRLPPPEKFSGTGVYALYYIGKFKPYEKYGQLNRLQYGHPIYIGKAVPKGWRQSRISDEPTKQSYELHGRLREHCRSIDIGADLDPSDFACRFVIFEGTGSDMISTIEASLIKLFKPLWNTVLDGFGNHDPGKGRYNQAKSDWDVLHAGRIWADRCTGVANPKAKVLSNISNHMELLK